VFLSEPTFAGKYNHNTSLNNKKVELVRHCFGMEEQKWK